MPQHAHGSTRSDRGAPASSPPSSTLQLVDRAALPRLVDEWDALSQAAADPNVFYAPRVLLPALDTLADSRVQVWILRGPGDRLDALLPIAFQPTWRGVPLPHWALWKHAYSYLSTPLVRAGQEIALAGALGRWLGAGPRRGSFLHLPMAHTDSAFLGALLRPGPRPLTVQPLGAHRRALLQSSGSADAYMRARLNRRRRKDYRRQARQLGQLGELSRKRIVEPVELRTWLTPFLELEAAGWKGVEGSALVQSDRSRGYMEQLFAGFQPGDAELLVLSLDHTPIAMKLNLHARPGSFAFKIAFDQTHARYSPGVLLELFNLECTLDRDDGPAWMDSCADPDHPMIDKLWSEQRGIRKLNIAAPGVLTSAALAAAGQLTRLESGLRARWAALPDETRSRVKQLRNRLLH